MDRIAEIRRTTKETDIYMKVNLDGTGVAKLDYPIGFMRHMLNTFAKHGFFDIEVQASGDLDVDQHHLVEDTGIALGQCFAKALGEKRGICRCGSCLFPMDETLARAAADISGRAYLVFNAGLSNIPLAGGVPAPSSGGPGAPISSTPSPNSPALNSTALFQTDTIEDFWQGFASASDAALHLDILRGRSDHHKIEALFKAAARALRDAVAIDPRSRGDIPSTKGTLGAPDAPPSAPDAPQTAPDAPPSAPNTPQAAPDIPPSAPDTPQAAPDIPPSAPDTPQTAPNTPQAAPDDKPSAPDVRRILSAPPVRLA